MAMETANHGSDYRKLTFFYYAEEYINFNDLVTDLFKVYKTRIWMSAINPASYSGLNPNLGMRPQQWPRPGQGQHAAYLRAQEEYRTVIENGRTQSPIDRDSPAARGNREYERLYRNGAYPAVSMSTGMSVVPGHVPSDGESSSLGNVSRFLTTKDYTSSMTSMYDPRRPNLPFNPNGGHFAHFAHQYGNNVAASGAWPPSGPAMGQAYPFAYPDTRDGAGNYSVAPAGPAALPSSGGLNQQAAAFTPRASIGQGQLAGTSIYPTNGDHEIGMLGDQFQRFAIDSRRA